MNGMQCVAFDVLIEGEGNREILIPKVFRGVVARVESGEWPVWYVVAPSQAVPAQ